jgi:hypothetical protein
MLPVRKSPYADNEDFVKDVRRTQQRNSAWIKESRASESDFCSPGDVVLLGGRSLADFRVRVAQSHARHDLTPSYWSLVGVVNDDRESILTAPLWPLNAPDRMPVTNGIQSVPITDFDDAVAWPNIGVVRFPGTRQKPVECVKRLSTQRSIIDVPSLILPWLGFVWGASSTANPLLNGFGIPSAVLVEAAFGLAEVELTPGLATTSSCPEAIYQAARWWSGYYREAAGRRRSSRTNHPVGRYKVRQREASYLEPKPDPALEYDAEE